MIVFISDEKYERKKSFLQMEFKYLIWNNAMSLNLFLVRVFLSYTRIFYGECF